MRNWSTDKTRLKGNLEQYAVWRLEQQLNYGLDEGEKIERELLEKHLPVLNIDKDTRDFLEFILYDKKPIHNTAKKIP